MIFREIINECSGCGRKAKWFVDGVWYCGCCIKTGLKKWKIVKE